MEFIKEVDINCSVVLVYKNKEHFIYYIKTYIGCITMCGDTRCDNMDRIIHTIKVRDIDTKKIVKTLKGTNKVKCEITKINDKVHYNEALVFDIYEENYLNK